ncbi:MAG: LpqB family beta-propeller domain-containing protein, partial [Propionicimonas sp.]|nr:hypothetical protein [Propionicimonas sp.]
TRVLVEFAANVGLDIDWSPDGSTLAYTAAPPGAARNLWLVGADGGPPRRLTDRPAGREAYSPTWSPDGDWLAFGEAGAGAPRLVRVRADGTGLSVLAELPGLAPRGLDWSPERPHR